MGLDTDSDLHHLLCNYLATRCENPIQNDDMFGGEIFKHRGVVCKTYYGQGSFSKITIEK